jgi:hypothetical protein
MTLERSPKIGTSHSRPAGFDWPKSEHFQNGTSTLIVYGPVDWGLHPGGIDPSGKLP